MKKLVLAFLLLGGCAHKQPENIRYVYIQPPAPPAREPIYCYVLIKVKEIINYSSIGLDPHTNDGEQRTALYLSPIRDFKGSDEECKEFEARFKDNTERALKLQLKGRPIDYKILSIDAYGFGTYANASKSVHESGGEEIEFPIGY